MATTIERVEGNFIYRLDHLTPTSGIIRNPFECFDPLMNEEPAGTGGLRKYYVEHVNTDPDAGATDMTAREAMHRYRVYMLYPTVLPYRRLQRLYQADLHDVIKALRDSALWTTCWTDENGTENTTDTVPIMERIRNATAVDRSRRDYWRVTTEWAVYIRESEL